MEFYISIYHFYRTAIARSVRVLILFFLFFLIMYTVAHHTSSKIPQFLFNLFVMTEIFFHFKISRTTPVVTVAKNDGKHIYDSFTLAALYPFLTEQTTGTIIKKLLGSSQIKLIMQKTNISQKDLKIENLQKDLLAKSAFETAQTFKAQFVSTADVFVAYLLLIEKEAKLLFAKQLKTEDLYNIASWVRQEYSDEESFKKTRIHFAGGGIGEALISGWTPETKKYTETFNFQEKPLILGREIEFKSLLEGLIKAENNNVLLVGDIGAGKENLVKAFAYHSYEGNLGEFLNYKRILQLLVGSFTAGATNRSDLEIRLQEIIAELSHARNVVLYIPEFQNILGATSYNLDLSGAILPYLKSGNMPIIATMTTGTYKTFMEHNPLKEVFNVVQLKEPDKSTALQMVMGSAKEIERKYRVILSYRAIIRATELASRFFQDEVLPGSAVLLLENVANVVAFSEKGQAFDKTHRKIVLESHVIKKVEETVHVAIAAPSESEIDLLLHLEDTLHKRIIGQQEAVSAISEAMRRIRTGMENSERPVSFLFLGPTGVGKTETAKALADIYYGGEKHMIRLDMSEYTDEDGLRRLLGAPPGQGQERGELTDKIHDNPASLVLLDEFEKANPKIHNLFLQVLDDGRLTDNKGVTVSFKNVIIIATSNAGSEFIREQVEKGNKINKQFQHQLLEHLQSKGLFKPELLNRFDDVITFKPLGENEVHLVIKLMMNSLVKTLQEQDIALTYDDAVIEKIAEQGFDKEFGARPLRRYIQDTIEDLIAQKKLAHEIDRGKTISLYVEGTGALAGTVT
jgi:ATP-dependent Clp protease ATP-binding subunit ClpA